MTSLDIYAQQEAEHSDIELEEQEEDNVQHRNYDDFEMDELRPDEEDGNELQCIDKEEEQRIHNELLFFIQGVGSIKNINNFDVYVKHS